MEDLEASDWFKFLIFVKFSKTSGKIGLTRDKLFNLSDHFQDGASSARESEQAWHSMVEDAAIKGRYSQHCGPCSPSLVDSLTQEMLEDHSSEESSMDKKILRDSREIFARPQYDESDTAMMVNGIKHQK